MSRYTERQLITLNPQQEAFLKKAHRTAYMEELYPDPNKRNSLEKFRKLLQESVANGIQDLHPLILADTYDEGREKARRTKATYNGDDTKQESA